MRGRYLGTSEDDRQINFQIGAGIVARLRRARHRLNQDIPMKIRGSIFALALARQIFGC